MIFVKPSKTSRTLIITLLLGSLTHAAESWYNEPFRIKAGNKLLDTFEFDAGGHAAPYLADLDGDKKRDLVVGSIGRKFRFFKNVGSDGHPEFGPASSWLMAGLNGDHPAEVPNFCCVAVGPQLFDGDGDGILDLVSGSFSPSTIYWFKGTGNQRFATRQILTEDSGLPILPRPDVNPYNPYATAAGDDNHANSMSNVSWCEWNDDDAPDLIVGNFLGQLFVKLNAKRRGNIEDIAPPPTRDQPTFQRSRFQAVHEIQIDGKNAIPGRHAAPSVADWDGDGLWDILVGSDTGAVYWLKNSGAPGKPVFNTRDEILGPGTAFHWLEAGRIPGRGVRTQIHAVDYNLDGKMDLLVGEWSVIQELRSDLTKEQREKVAALRAELMALDKQVGFEYYNPEYRFSGYVDSKLRQDGEKLYFDKAMPIEKQLREFLRVYDNLGILGGVEVPQSPIRFSGHVWVYLRK